MDAPCPLCMKTEYKKHCKFCKWRVCESCRVIFDPQRGTWLQKNIKPTKD